MQCRGLQLRQRLMWAAGLDQDWTGRMKAIIIAALTTRENSLEIVVDTTELLVDPGRKIPKDDDIEERLQAVEPGPGAVALVAKEVAVHLEAIHGAVDAEFLVGGAAQPGTVEPEIAAGGGECLREKVAVEVLDDGMHPAEAARKVQVKWAGKFKGITDPFGVANGVGLQEMSDLLHIAAVKAT